MSKLSEYDAEMKRLTGEAEQLKKKRDAYLSYQTALAKAQVANIKLLDSVDRFYYSYQRPAPHALESSVDFTQALGKLEEQMETLAKVERYVVSDPKTRLVDVSQRSDIKARIVAQKRKLANEMYVIRQRRTGAGLDFA